MNSIWPMSFVELLGGACLAMGSVLVLISLMPGLRTTTTRLAAILLLVALALFSNHWATYFASIFIIATAVTELEFLHILAAIIRGDKNYFDYRREFLTREEAMLRSRDSVETDVADVKDESGSAREEPRLKIPADVNSVSNVHRMHLAFGIEEAALSFLEKALGRPLERYVRFTGSGGVAEVDAFIRGENGGPDTLVEVKWIRARGQAKLLLRIIPRLAELLRRYKSITRRNAELLLLAVVPSPDMVPEQIQAHVLELLTQAGVKGNLRLVTYGDLGIQAESDNA